MSNFSDSIYFASIKETNNKRMLRFLNFLRFYYTGLLTNEFLKNYIEQPPDCMLDQ